MIIGYIGRILLVKNYDINANRKVPSVFCIILTSPYTKDRKVN